MIPPYPVCVPFLREDLVLEAAWKPVEPSSRSLGSRWLHANFSSTRAFPSLGRARLLRRLGLLSPRASGPQPHPTWSSDPILTFRGADVGGACVTREEGQPFQELIKIRKQWAGAPNTSLGSSGNTPSAGRPSTSSPGQRPGQPAAAGGRGRRLFFSNAGCLNPAEKFK